MTDHNPNPLPEFWPVISSSYPYDGGLPPRTTGAEESYDLGRYMTSVGNGSLATMTALDTTFTVWDRIGRQRIEDYILGLGGRLKENVADRWGKKAFYSPMADKRLGARSRRGTRSRTCGHHQPGKVEHLGPAGAQ
ncbi:MAG: hypothetical protein GEV07_24870 [Streptosporangiales bacterium]|nr:hypothetical protein [Streptosporangiales bacterium]